MKNTFFTSRQQAQTSLGNLNQPKTVQSNQRFNLLKQQFLSVRGQANMVEELSQEKRRKQKS